MIFLNLMVSVLRPYEKDLREINNKRLQKSYDVTVNRDKKKTTTQS